MVRRAKWKVRTFKDGRKIDYLVKGSRPLTVEWVKGPDRFRLSHRYWLQVGGQEIGHVWKANHSKGWIIHTWQNGTTKRRFRTLKEAKAHLLTRLTYQHRLWATWSDPDDPRNFL